MPVSPDINGANAAIERYLRRADAMVQCSDREGRQAARALLQTLVDADKSIAKRLEYWVERRLGGMEMRFSEASLIVFREQVQVMIALVQARLLGITNSASLRAARESLRMSTGLFNELERLFTGIVRPIPLDRAAMARLRPSLLARHATSVDRYGAAMVTRMERILAQGYAEGITNSQMVDRIVGLRGPVGRVSIRAVEIQPGVVVRLTEDFIPEGLFVRHRSWAWRIVRTETAEAQNAASDESIERARERFDDTRRKILAVMDNKTAMDSIYVHGQIKARDEMFVDGAGRRYLRPPARPNDRETIIPWREGWPETDRSRRLSSRGRSEMIERNTAWQAERAAKRRRLQRARRRRIERQQARQADQ
jgi:hypothetical protein